MVQDACYRKILKNKFTERYAKNKSYSLRAFARDLKVSPQRLSNILNEKQGLSTQAAQQIATRLGLNDQEKEYFCVLVQEKHSRSNSLKIEARKRLQEIVTQYKDLSLDNFKIISDWYHFAIMELTLVVGFSSNPAWIAKTLKISKFEAKIAIERLIKLGLMEQDANGALRITGNYFADPRGTPSDALRSFHRQLMAKASEALTIQTLDEREFASTVIAIDEEEIPSAKEALRRFRTRFSAKYSAAKAKSSVYCLGTQFFSLLK